MKVIHTTTCANCERKVPALWESEGLPDSGLFFQKNSMGYYAGFFDNYPFDNDDEGYFICHDCAVLFMQTFPGLAKQLLPRRGGHPTTSDYPTPPCCAWAWTWDTEAPCPKCGQAITCIANDKIEWDRKECPCDKL